MAKIGCKRRCYRTAWGLTSMGRTRRVIEVFNDELDLTALGLES
jgi:hypothetical protein